MLAQGSSRDSTEKFGMSTRASIEGRPDQAMMIELPAGWFSLSFVCDMVWMAIGSAEWATVSSYTLAVPAALSFVAVLLLGVSGWLGGTPEAAWLANNVTARPGPTPVDSRP